MATIIELNTYLKQWTRWRRTRNALRWLVYGALIGAGSGLVFAFIRTIQLELLSSQVFVVVLVGASAGAVFGSLIAALWPFPKERSARYFDLHLGLKERSSTALELAADTKNIPTELIDKQLTDAVQAARAAKPRQALPLRYHWRDLVIALLLVGSTFLLWKYGSPYFEQAQTQHEVEEAIVEEIQNIEELITEIEGNAELDADQKEALTQPLEEAITELEEAESVEQAVSTLMETEEKLQALANPEIQSQAQGLREAGERLMDSDNTLSDFGEALAEGNLEAAAEALENLDTSQMSESELGELAQELSEAAESLQATNPELARQLSEMAGALQSGDLQEFEGQLAEAGELLELTQEQLETLEAAQVAAGELQDGEAAIAAAGGEGGEGQGLLAGQGSGQGQGNGQNNLFTESDESGGGAGRGSVTGESGPGDEVGSTPIGQNNGAGDAGETQYEQIYAPQRMGGEAEVGGGLPQSDEPGDQILGQTPSDPNESGQSVVPYTEVLAEYEEIYRTALDSGDIPPQFRQLIKEYFSSLEP
jgi:hypothetical protein